MGLQTKEDCNEVEECLNSIVDKHSEYDSDESEECHKGQAQDVLNSINEAVIRAEETIPLSIEDSIEINAIRAHTSEI